MSADLTRKSGWRDEGWDDALVRHPEATFFHTRIWARIVARAFPSCTDRSAWFAGPEGEILLPVFVWRRARGLVSTAHSSFPFLYGGPVPLTRSGSLEPMRIAFEYLRSLWSSIRINGNPFVPEPGDVLAPLGSDPARPRTAIDRTYVIDLPTSEEAYWEGLSSGKRNDVRRLSKKGVVIEETRRAEDIDAVYGHYRTSFERWGGKPAFVYPPEFYHALVALGGGCVRFTVARIEDRILGGSFVVRWNGRAHYLAGYFDHESRQLRPNVLLQIESIRDAIRSGLREYDFLPSGGHTAVEEFKAGLGGKERQFPVFEERRTFHRWIDRLRGSLSRSNGSLSRTGEPLPRTGGSWS